MKSLIRVLYAFNWFGMPAALSQFGLIAADVSLKLLD